MILWLFGERLERTPITGNGVNLFSLVWILISGSSRAPASVSCHPTSFKQVAERHRSGGGKHHELSSQNAHVTISSR